MRVWDSTAELRYLVLPERPAGTEDWDVARLAGLVTRNSMIGTERDLGREQWRREQRSVIPATAEPPRISWTVDPARATGRSMSTNRPSRFTRPWEARLFGIVRAFTRPARLSIDWFRHVRECIDPADYLTPPYYDQWLQTYAAMMVDSGAVTVEELATGKSAQAIPACRRR